MSFLIALCFVTLFVIVVFIVVALRSPKSPPPHYEPTVNDNFHVPSTTKPRISADVSEQFRSEVDFYCSRHSITISELVRRAVESYIYSDQCTSPAATLSSSVDSAPKPTTRRSVVRPDGTWQCPRCKKINASYVGTCSCGVTKDSAPTISIPRKPSYIREDGSWKCPKCGKVNASYVGTCSCGRSKE